MDRKGNRSFQILVVGDEADIEPLINQRMRSRICSGKYRFLFARDGIKALVIPSESPSIGNLSGRALTRAPLGRGFPDLPFPSSNASTATVAAASP